MCASLLSCPAYSSTFHLFYTFFVSSSCSAKFDKLLACLFLISSSERKVNKLCQCGFLHYFFLFLIDFCRIPSCQLFSRVAKLKYSECVAVSNFVNSCKEETMLHCESSFFSLICRLSLPLIFLLNSDAFCIVILFFLLFYLSTFTYLNPLFNLFPCSAVVDILKMLHCEAFLSSVLFVDFSLVFILFFYLLTRSAEVYKHMLKVLHCESLLYSFLSLICQLSLVLILFFNFFYGFCRLTHTYCTCCILRLFFLIPFFSTVTFFNPFFQPSYAFRRV